MPKIIRTVTNGLYRGVPEGKKEDIVRDEEELVEDVVRQGGQDLVVEAIVVTERIRKTKLMARLTAK